MAHACRPRDSPGPASFGAYAEAMRAADLQVTDGEIVWRWDDRLLDRPRWPEARSAIELATGGHSTYTM